MDVFVRKLQPSDKTDHFDCGDAALNDYFHRFAKKNQTALCGTTYVCIVPPNNVVGFYTIATTSIPRTGIPDNLVKGLPKYQNLPAILLGRLAVDHRAQGKKIGELLISHCFDVCLHVTKLCGARYLVTDAYVGKTAFYEKYGFRSFGGNNDPALVKMFIDLNTVRIAVNQRRREAFA